jgi:hypothetical protein
VHNPGGNVFKIASVDEGKFEDRKHLSKPAEIAGFSGFKQTFKALFDDGGNEDDVYESGAIVNGKSGLL